LSEIRADTISDAAGTGPIALTKQSAAKVFAHWGLSGGSPVLKDSLNTSSITDDAVGDFRVNFTSSLNTSTYSQYGSAGGSGGSSGDESFMAFASTSGGTPSQGNKIRCRRGSGNVLGSLDAVINTYLAHGDLA